MTEDWKSGGDALARRITAACAAAIFLLAAPGQAQRLGYADVSAYGAAPAPRLGYEDVADWGGLRTQAPGPIGSPSAAETESGRVREVYLDRMEIVPQAGRNGYSWDVAALIGGPRHRLYLASAADGSFGGALHYFELQALYSRAISNNWDLQAGLRYDLRPHPQRANFTFGAQGSATDALYLGAFGFLSHRGEFSARIFGQYDIALPSRFILQPSFEAEFYAQDVPALGIGRGPAFGEAGLRLRHEVAEAFAPYLGVSWERSFGRTARFAREVDEEVGGRSLVLGIRSWF
jgi:copper resistance protein B